MVTFCYRIHKHLCMKEIGRLNSPMYSSEYKCIMWNLTLPCYLWTFYAGLPGTSLSVLLFSCLVHYSFFFVICTCYFPFSCFCVHPFIIPRILLCSYLVWTYFLCSLICRSCMLILYTMCTPCSKVWCCHT